MADFGLPDGCVAVETTPIILDDGCVRRKTIHVQGHHPELRSFFCAARCIDDHGQALTEITLSYGESPKIVASAMPPADDD
jgi:hypothetical protein